MNREGVGELNLTQNVSKQRNDWLDWLFPYWNNITQQTNTLNDLCETLFLHIIRKISRRVWNGSMFNGFNYVRPLLFKSSADNRCGPPGFFTRYSNAIDATCICVCVLNVLCRFCVQLCKGL